LCRRRHKHDLRHTFATVALRAGLGTYVLSRYMGTSLINIDRTYGHLARDIHHHAIELLDDYSSGCRLVDTGGRSVDVGTIAPLIPRPTAACREPPASCLSVARLVQDLRLAAVRRFHSASASSLGSQRNTYHRLSWSGTARWSAWRRSRPAGHAR
jgi:hypothetical protein